MPTRVAILLAICCGLIAIEVRVDPADPSKAVLSLPGGDLAMMRVSTPGYPLSWVSRGLVPARCVEGAGGEPDAPAQLTLFQAERWSTYHGGRIASWPETAHITARSWTSTALRELHFPMRDKVPGLGTWYIHGPPNWSALRGPAFDSLPSGRSQEEGSTWGDFAGRPAAAGWRDEPQLFLRLPFTFAYPCDDTPTRIAGQPFRVRTGVDPGMIDSVYPIPEAGGLLTLSSTALVAWDLGSGLPGWTAEGGTNLLLTPEQTIVVFDYTQIRRLRQRDGRELWRRHLNHAEYDGGQPTEIRHPDQQEFDFLPPLLIGDFIVIGERTLDRSVLHVLRLSDGAPIAIRGNGAFDCWCGVDEVLDNIVDVTPDSVTLVVADDAGERSLQTRTWDGTLRSQRPINRDEADALPRKPLTAVRTDDNAAPMGPELVLNNGEVHVRESTSGLVVHAFKPSTGTVGTVRFVDGVIHLAYSSPRGEIGLALSVDGGRVTAKRIVPPVKTGNLPSGGDLGLAIPLGEWPAGGCIGWQRPAGFQAFPAWHPDLEPSQANGMAPAPVPGQVLVSHEDGVLRRFDLMDGRCLSAWSDVDLPSQTYVREDRRWLFIGNYGCAIVDPESGPTARGTIDISDPSHCRGRGLIVGRDPEDPNCLLLLDEGDLRLRLRIAFTSDGLPVPLTPEGNYAADRETVAGLHLFDGERSYAAASFDLALNRPDLVASCLGGDAKAIAALRAAVERRVRMSGRQPQQPSSRLPTPTARIDRASLPFVTTDAQVDLQIAVEGPADEPSDTPLRLLLWVDGVPYPDRKGVPVRAGQHRLTVPLRVGLNGLTVCVRDGRGRDSPRSVAGVRRSGTTPSGRLVVAALGVSAYADPGYALRYAAKDATDVAGTLQNIEADARILLLRDGEVSHTALPRIRQHFASAGLDDRVVLFIAGHGVLDGAFDYWFALANMDFAKPEVYGIPFREIEDVMDGVAARRRLVLIDTCHSGEVDREGMRTIASVPSPDGVRVRGMRSFAPVAPALFDFLDVRTHAGAWVLSSAGGAEFALESDTWANGAFTAALLASLSNEKRLSVSQLRHAVIRRTSELTGGLQTPSARSDQAADFELLPLRP